MLPKNLVALMLLFLALPVNSGFAATMQFDTLHNFSVTLGSLVAAASHHSVTLEGDAFYPENPPDFYDHKEGENSVSLSGAKPPWLTTMSAGSTASSMFAAFQFTGPLAQPGDDGYAWEGSKQKVTLTFQVPVSANYNFVFSDAFSYRYSLQTSVGPGHALKYNGWQMYFSLSTTFGPGGYWNLLDDYYSPPTILTDIDSLPQNGDFATAISSVFIPAGTHEVEFFMEIYMDGTTTYVVPLPPGFLLMATGLLALVGRRASR